MNASFELTRRQAEVCELVALGHSYKVVAARLGISFYTVDEHIQAAAERIGGPGSSRARIMRWWLSSLFAA